MTKAEITAYNYGKRLARAAQEEVKGGRDGTVIAASLMTPEEQASLDRLGQARWWAQVQKGGQEILGEPDVVPPLQA